MKRRLVLKILLYGPNEEHESIKELFHQDERLAYRKIELVSFDDYDEYVTSLKDGCDLVVVFARGAKGMESVIAAKNVNAKTHVVWFSDDKDFAFQSYRLGVSYFGVCPVTPLQVSNALKRLYN